MSLPANPDSNNSIVPSKRRGVLRVLAWTLASLVVLLVLLIALFLIGIPLPGDRLRAQLEDLLSDVFSVPTRIEGPLRLRTGMVASAEAGALILADAVTPSAPPLARATGVSVRIDLAALLRRTVVLDEISAKQVEIRLEVAADGRGNWTPLLATSGGPPPVVFAGIGSLRIGELNGSYRAKPDAKPVRWDLTDLASSLIGSSPVTARGKLSMAGRTLAFDASSASLAELMEGPNKPIPLKATVESAGARVEVAGNYAPATTALESTVHVSAKDADALLAALGVSARKAGPLDARGEVRVDAREAAVNKLALQLGKTSLSGNARVNWTGARPLIGFDLAAERVDPTPFLTGTEPEPAQNRKTTPIVDVVDHIHQAATSIDLDGKASIREFIGMAAGWRNGTIEARIDDRLLTVRSSGEVFGMRAKDALEYSARDPKRTLTWHLEGGRFSTEKLPGGVRPGEVAGTLGGLRGELKAAGTTAEQLVASARLNLDARDLRFLWSRPGERPQELHLTSARIDVASARSARAEVHGRIGGRPCTMSIAGGTLQSLIAGERWPLTLDASCRDAKLVSRGHVLMKGRETTAAFRFDGSANPIGPLGGALGLATDVPHDFAISGELALTEALVDVKLARFQLGHTVGSGTASVTREGRRPHRVELALKTVDIAEVATLAPRGEKKAPVDPLAREVLPVDVHIPDLDLAITAGTVRYGAQAFRRVRLNAAPREGHVRNAGYAFGWRGAEVAGEASADLRSKRPTVELSGTVKGADLGAALAGAGEKAFGFRAGMIKAEGRASGAKLGELLGSATADVDVEQARFANVHQFLPGLTGDAEFSAKAAVAAGQAAKLSAKGIAGKLPLELTIETAPLTQLAEGKDRIPGTLRASLGETRLEGSGHLTRAGAMEARLTVSGKRLDQLGQLVGAKLAEVGPYSASAHLALAPDSIQASSIDAKFGKTHVLGTVGMDRGARPAYSADLRAPVLHLEDLGLHALMGTSGKSGAAGATSPSGGADAAKDVEQLQKTLRAFDAKATLDVKELYAEGKRYANLQAGLSLQRGKLEVTLEDQQLAGGKAHAEADLDVSGSQPGLRMRVHTDGYDFGALAEALKPNTPLEGTVDLSVNVVLAGMQPPLLGNVNGHVDLAVFPRDLHIGAADYWGTSLLHVMQRTIDPASQSKLNCAVLIFDVKDGIARSEAFFADTTRVRIIGQLEANLATRDLSGRLSPNAKNPGFFSVAPSVGISGTMESPQVVLTADSLITAPLRLFFPIHAFALDWVKATGVSADGSDGCREAFKRATSVAAKPPPPPKSSPRFWPF